MLRMKPADRFTDGDQNPPSETNRRTRGRPMLWLLTSLFIFSMVAGCVLALDWLDPQNSRLF